MAIMMHLHGWIRIDQDTCAQLRTCQTCAQGESNTSWPGPYMKATIFNLFRDSNSYTVTVGETKSGRYLFEELSLRELLKRLVVTVDSG